MANLADFFFNIVFCSLFFFFLLCVQSKHKKGTSVTRPILLDEPSLRYICFLLFPFFSLHVLPLPHVFVCLMQLRVSLVFTYVFIYIYIFIFLGGARTFLHISPHY